ncbi:acyltransferase family protein [Nocardia otitidiscaviarum]|nr:acyltransferase [Nocardia otitidiscaviarum]
MAPRHGDSAPTAAVTRPANREFDQRGAGVEESEGRRTRTTPHRRATAAPTEFAERGAAAVAPQAASASGVGSGAAGCAAQAAAASGIERDAVERAANVASEPGAASTEFPRRPAGFLPALEGMRGMAALGVVVTHVAFQTGATSLPMVGRVLERFDMAVAVFFALSGFLLWRPHAAAARGLGTAPAAGRYLLHRAARILPAYWAVVCAVLILLPTAASTAGFRVWLANLGLVQVFVPLTLTDGLTQMWSLSVEMAFYLLLPLLAVAVAWLRGDRARWRVPVLLAFGTLCLTWNLIPVPTPDAINSDNWLPGYLPWFAAGMLLAELSDLAVPRLRRLAGNPWLLWTVALVALLLSATDLGGLPGLTRGAPWQYVLKMAFGAIIGFTLLAPLVLRPDIRHRWLESRTAAMLGRWSYGVFLWHLAVLSIVFPVFAIVPFSGDFPQVLALTIALTLPLAAASYALIEEPVRRWARRFG